MKLYVGNLSFDMTERTLRELFEPFGTVSEVKLIMDRETGRSLTLGQVFLIGTRVNVITERSKFLPTN
jgi:RNA recognition motif-containing protein